MVLGTGRSGWGAASCTLGEGGLERREKVGLGEGLRLPLGECEETKEEKGERVAAREEARAEVIW